jgi:glycosyltransferase involved in cell wall biosynthesis
MTGSRALVVRGPYRGQSGHDHHVREFVRELARQGVRQQLVGLPEWASVRLPDHLQDPWFDSLDAPVDAHAVVHFCMPHQVRVVEGRLNVNYTMFEATRIPRSWMISNLFHDLVVVPTASSRNAWVGRGFPAERIRLCPLGVDPGRFRPGLDPLKLTDRQGRPVREYGVRVLNVSDLTPRKNLLGLLRVWIRATTPRDNAILILKLSPQTPGATVRLMRDVDALERALGKTRREAAPILFYQQVLSDAEMPRLFAVATHYWSMSRGEAWDQPMVESAAAGLRLIAPRHSAYEAYLDESVATMIPARQVAASSDAAGTAWLFAGTDWWEPDEEASEKALHDVMRGADDARATARTRIAAEFTWERATTRLIAIFEELHTSRGLAF